MKARIVKTSFYSDSKVEGLSKDAKWLFMYCITNSYIGLTGAYQLSDTRIMFETSLTPKELEKAKEELQKKHFVFFNNDWVIVLNSEKHNSYNSSPKTQKPFNTELSHLPEKIKNILYPIDRVSENDDRVCIPIEVEVEEEEEEEIEKGIVKGKNKHSSISDIGDQEIRDIADGYQVPESFVRSKLEDLDNHCLSKGKKYSNYFATLKAWVKKDAITVRKESRGKNNITLINPS